MYERIVDYLQSRDASYDVMTHDPIVTSADAATARGTDLSQGLKCLLLQTDEQHVLAVIPGDAKLASKKGIRYINVGLKYPFHLAVEIQKRYFLFL